MNIFTVLKKYAEKWSVTNVRPFDQEELDSIKSVKIVDSQYGCSVCFILKEGGMSFIPLEADSPLKAGDPIDLTKAQIVTLSKTGEEDIQRVRV